MDSRQYRIRFLKHFPPIFLLTASILGSGCLPKESDLSSNLEVNLPTQLDTRALSGNCADNLWADVLIDHQATAKLQKTGGNWQGEIKLPPGPHALKIEFKCTTNNFGTVVLATYTEDINLAANDSLNLSSGNYQYPDNDQDSSSNLAEIKAGTDPGSPSNGFKWANPLPQGNTLTDVIWNGSEFLAVGGGGSILTSGDGESWSLSYSAASTSFTAIAWSGTQYIVVGGQGRILRRAATNSDWTIVESGTQAYLSDITWTGKKFIAVGGGIVATSSDGAHWTILSIPDVSILWGVTWMGDKLVAAGSAWNPDTQRVEGVIVTSDDGTAWSTPLLTGTPLILDVTWTGSQLVAVGGDKFTSRGPPLDDGSFFYQGGVILTSTDGKTWEQQASGTDLDLHAVHYESSSGRIITAGGNSSLYAVNPDYGVILSSSDGVNWVSVESNEKQIYEGLASSGSQTVVVGNYGTIKSSTDLQHWSNRTSGSLNSILDMVSMGDQVIAVGEKGEVFTSLDGRSWASRNSGITTNLWGITWTGSRLVAVGGEASEAGNGVILTSTDGLSWINRTPASSLGTLTDVTWTGSQLVAVGGKGLILTSPNGIDWTSRYAEPSNPLWAVSANSDQIVVTGSFGTILTSSDGGAHWSKTSLDENIDLLSITWTGSSFVAVGGTSRSPGGSEEDNGMVFISADGTNWETIDLDLDGVIYDVTWTGEQLLAIADNSTLISSEDGITWSKTPTISSMQQSCVLQHQGVTLIGGGGGTILYREN